MNTKRTPIRREEEGVGNAEIYPCGEQVPISNQQNVNEVVTPQVTQACNVPTIEVVMSYVEIRIVVHI